MWFLKLKETEELNKINSTPLTRAEIKATVSLSCLNNENADEYSRGGFAIACSA